jgi:hypothetical protein
MIAGRFHPIWAVNPVPDKSRYRKLEFHVSGKGVNQELKIVMIQS